MPRAYGRLFILQDGNSVGVLHSFSPMSPGRTPLGNGAPGETRTPDPLVRSCQVVHTKHCAWRLLRSEQHCLSILAVSRLCVKIYERLKECFSGSLPVRRLASWEWP